MLPRCGDRSVYVLPKGPGADMITDGQRKKRHGVPMKRPDAIYAAVEGRRHKLCFSDPQHNIRWHDGWRIACESPVVK